MIPIRIKNENKITIAETQDQFYALEIVPMEDGLVSLWELSEVEKQAIANNGVVRLSILSNVHPGVILRVQSRNGELVAQPNKSFIECVKELIKHSIATDQTPTKILTGFAQFDGMTVCNLSVKYNEKMPINKVSVLSGSNTIGALMFTETVGRNTIIELMDYATSYGEFDEDTPNGTLSTVGGSAMNDKRRTAIVCYKKILGLIDT